jgi:transcription termination factor NusB
MRKKLTSFKYIHYNDEQLKSHIHDNVVNEKFEQHCAEVAKNLEIDPIIVKELLLDNSFTVLSLLQKAILKFRYIKVNITGFFSLRTMKNFNKVKYIKKQKS